MVTIYNWFLGNKKSLNGITFSCYKYKVLNKFKYGVAIDCINDHNESFLLTPMISVCYEPIDSITSQIPQLTICVDEPVCVVNKALCTSILVLAENTFRGIGDDGIMAYIDGIGDVFCIPANALAEGAIALIPFTMLKRNSFLHQKEGLLWYEVRVHMRLCIIKALRKCKATQVRVSFGLSFQHWCIIRDVLLGHGCKAGSITKSVTTSHNMAKRDNLGVIGYCSFIRTNVSMLERVVTCDRNDLNSLFGNEWGWANRTSNHNDFVTNLDGVVVLSGLNGRIELSYLNSNLSLLMSVKRGRINADFLACPALSLDDDNQGLVNTLSERAYYLISGTIHEIEQIVYRIVPDSRKTRSGKLTISFKLTSLLDDSVLTLSHHKVQLLQSPHPFSGLMYANRRVCLPAVANVVSFNIGQMILQALRTDTLPECFSYSMLSYMRAYPTFYNVKEIKESMVVYGIVDHLNADMPYVVALSTYVLALKSKIQEICPLITVDPVEGRVTKRTRASL